ncbi:MAG: DegT/DnrJ/EryC1/StrS family aminotransferase, partial [Bacteroidia bacterium]|nr:DegT/DnrJ/EryC1/StrS family aminotransferase [Bacteroidia bacterium]
KQYNLAVIEDTAQAIGATYTFINGEKYSAGCIGDVGTCSFFPSKNLGCYGDGGALFTNNDELAIKLRMICNHGQVKQYEHEIIGVNSRLDTIQAAILSVKLKYLNSYTERRINSANLYDSLLSNYPEIVTPFRNNSSTHVFHQYTIKVPSDKRDFIKNELYNRGIPTMIYYPKGLHHQNAFKKYKSFNSIFPICNELCYSVLSLPMHTELSAQSIEFICDNLLELLDK